MDLINDIVKEKAGDLIGALTGQAGYSMDEAERFLPEAGSEMTSAFLSRSSDLDLENLSSQANISKLLGGIDVGGLASRVGVPEKQGSDGLGALLPMVLGFLGQKGGGAAGLLALLGNAGDLGDKLDKLKGLGGKLFG